VLGASRINALHVVVCLHATPPNQGEGALMNSFNPDYFIHGANVLLLLAYSVRDIVWLRGKWMAISPLNVPCLSDSHR
jgi:hypothetical protein